MAFPSILPKPTPVKWTILVMLAGTLFIFWPKDDSPTSSPPLERKPPPSHRSSIKRKHPSRHSSSRQLDKARSSDLKDQIRQQWPEIESGLHARDPRVVKFIKTLRELGRRNGPETLAFLDDLERKDKEAIWIQARMAAAGGWALSDPEAAARALLEKDHILPENYQSLTMDEGLGTMTPSHQSITRAARKIFDLWAEIDPNEIRRIVQNNAIDPWVWNYEIRAQLSAVTNIDSPPSETASISRVSIDAILNNPDRTAADFKGSSYLPLTEEMKTLGEPAANINEWAARNPEHALAMIKDSRNRGEPTSTSLIAGLARGNDDYEYLLQLAGPAAKMTVAKHLAHTMQHDLHEDVWQLDGRKTTWALTPGDRMQAVQRLLGSSVFSEEESKALTTLFHEIKAPGFGLIIDDLALPELPNKIKDPAE